MLIVNGLAAGVDRVQRVADVYLYSQRANWQNVRGLDFVEHKSYKVGQVLSLNRKEKIS